MPKKCPITGESHCKCFHKTILTAEKPTLKDTVRKLFTDHAAYTKFFIESFLNSSEDVKAIENRLLQNQQDIGNAVKPIIGITNGNQLTALLTQHIILAAEVLNQLKQNNQSKLKTAINNLFNNSEHVAEFLNSLNPQKLPLPAIADEFHQHNQFVIDLALLHSEKKWEEEVSCYDAYYNHMLHFADLIYQALKK